MRLRRSSAIISVEGHIDLGYELELKSAARSLLARLVPATYLTVLQCKCGSLHLYWGNPLYYANGTLIDKSAIKRPGVIRAPNQNRHKAVYR